MATTVQVDWENFGRGLRQGHWRGRFRNWGLKGVGKAGLEGAAASIGLFRNPEGKMRWLGGSSTVGALRGGLVGAGVGGAVYAATGSGLLGIGAGVGATIGMKQMGGMMKLAAPAFTAFSMYEGYKQGGIGGAIGAGARTAAEWALFDIGIGALKTAFKGSAIGGTVGGVMKAATSPITLGIAALGIGAYYGAKGLAERGRQAVRTEFVGDMEAFNTQAAYSMRQRALQEINRSHTNSRTILGNEAQLMHL